MINVKDVYTVSKWEQKQQYMKEHRDMWRNCFQDPLRYEDFYFQHVYPHNEVYGIEGCGMLHVNRYLCSVFGCHMELPYIVGVATKETCRRQGIMRCTMERVLTDLKGKQVPFTYLMPAKEAYYYDFGFRKVSDWRTSDIVPKKKNRQRDYIFVSYEEIKKKAHIWQHVLRQIHSTLQQQFDVFAVHDEHYFDLLYAEKSCQDGDVIFVFEDMCDDAHFRGFFAYVFDRDTPLVEQIRCDDVEVVCSEFFLEYPLVKCVYDYPYMMKIIHRESFVALFKEVLDGVSVDDLSDEVLIDFVRQRKNCLYFAEIV